MYTRIRWRQAAFVCQRAITAGAIFDAPAGYINIDRAIVVQLDKFLATRACRPVQLGLANDDIRTDCSSGLRDTDHCPHGQDRNPPPEEILTHGQNDTEGCP